MRMMRKVWPLSSWHACWGPVTRDQSWLYREAGAHTVPEASVPLTEAQHSPGRGYGQFPGEVISEKRFLRLN